MANQTPIPIAIVGIGCRFPGGANDTSKFWDLLSEGRSAWSEVPSDRFNWKSFHHPDPNANGALNHRGGHFIDKDVSTFDPNFFGIPPPEAHAMDPQQRIQLETTYEALENAGMPLDHVRGSNTSVYIAIFSRDYDRMMYKDTSDIAKYHMIGVGEAIAANRISYILDLKGPSMTLDTGCSGSLVALHQACQSLRNSESDMALVGGTNLILSPDSMIPMSLLHILNAEGKCYPFDSRGSGYGRGEGVATVVLKRLPDALQAGDSVRAIIRATGVNQDGRTNGIALPSQEAQEELVRSVYKATEMSPLDVDYVEAHGTGTIAGDTIETKSIANTFTAKGRRKSSLFMGSVKSNLGHLESSSGIAGLIKTVLALEKGQIPPNVDLRESKHGIDLDTWNIKVPSTLTEWPVSECKTRRASVNSFGYGGTNAHVILESAPLPLTDGGAGGFSDCTTIKRDGIQEHELDDTATHSNLDIPRLFVLTARSESSLLRVVSNLHQWALKQDQEDISLSDLAYTLSCRRSLLQWRKTFVAASLKEFKSSVDQSERHPPTNRTLNDVRLTFLFTGQGAQWAGMGRELIHSCAGFRNSLSRSDAILKDLGYTWSLIDELELDESRSRLNQSSIAQPSTIALQIALVDVLDHLNIKPSIVLGHSSGEIAAAYAAQILSHEMALKVAYHRSLLSKVLQDVSSKKGAMLAVGVGEDRINNYISRTTSGLISVACVNSPDSTTISGDEAAIDELSDLLTRDSIFSRRLKVDTAYHSYHMRYVAECYLESLKHLVWKPAQGSVQFVSSVTALEKSSDFGPSYWVDNLISKVRFAEALSEVRSIQQAGLGSSIVAPLHVFLELGPHGALAGPFRQTFSVFPSTSFKYLYIPTLIRGRDATRCVLELVGKLFEYGHAVFLENTCSLDRSPVTSRTLLRDLPSYPWDHSTSYWHESRLSREYRLRQYPYHDLLGVRVITSTSFEPVWRNIISLQSLPWLSEHVIDGLSIFPGSGYLCMAIQAIRQVLDGRKASGQILRYRMKDVSFLKILTIPDSPAKVETQISLRSARPGTAKTLSTWEEFQITSFHGGTWNEHCRGFIMAESNVPVDEVEATREHAFAATAAKQRMKEIREACDQEIDSHQMYQHLREHGNEYGPNFALLDRIRVGDFKMVGTVTTPDIAASMPGKHMEPHVVHPTTLDALVHASIPLYHQYCTPGSVMPVRMDEISISASVAIQPGDELITALTIEPTGPRSATTEILVFQKDMASELSPVISISQGELRGLGETQAVVSDPNEERGITYRFEWQCDADHKIFSDSVLAVDGTQEIGKLGEGRRLLNEKATLYIEQLLEDVQRENLDLSSGRHVSLYDWMKRYSQSDQYSQHLRSTGCSSSHLQPEPSSPLYSEGQVLARLGQKLKPIMFGGETVDDEELLRIYNEDISSLSLAHLITYIRELIFKKSNLKILELGAHDGAVARCIFSQLDRAKGSQVQQYHLTNRTSSLVEQLEYGQQDQSLPVEIMTLDIEVNPLEQGFLSHTYDLVIATNLRRGISSTDNALRNVADLLNSTGKLALVEVTKEHPAYELMFGLLPPSSKATHDITDSHVLSIEEWNTVLKSSEFTGIDFTVNDLDDTNHRSSLILSSPRRSTPQSEALALSSVSILNSNASISPFPRALARGFEQRGFNAKFESWSTEYGAKDMIYVVLDIGEIPLLLENQRFEQVKRLLTRSSKILWIGASESVSPSITSEQGLINGVARVARSENEGLKLVTLRIEASITEFLPILVAKSAQILYRSFGQSEAKGSPCELEYIFRGGQLLIPRLIPDNLLNGLMTASTGKLQTGLAPFHQASRPLRLKVEKPGLLDSLVFDDDENLMVPLKSDQVELHVQACALNFKDVMIALGQMKAHVQMAGESAGVITAVGSDFRSTFRVGDRVCGFNGTPYASHARYHGTSVCHLPPSMSFNTGASILGVFATAYYGLHDIAKVTAGQTVLIHAAAGGVGQAAIMIAKSVGAEVFATVGSSLKRELLMSLYDIPETHIFSSRLRTFKPGIMRLTKGKGVDIILNSLSGEALHDSFDCIANFGTFLEIGKSDIYRKSQLSMEAFDKSVTFASIDLSLLANLKRAETRQLLSNVMSLLESGAVKPVSPIKVMPMSEIEHAFRLVQGRKHTGKIVLEVDEETLVKVISAKPTSLQLCENATYVIAGGLGDIGRKITQFMVAHGAKNIVLLSRRNLPLHERIMIADELSQEGTTIYILTCDIANRGMVEDVIQHCKTSLPPIKGLVQAAMVLDDTILEQMDVAAFNLTQQPKLYGTRYLSESLADLPMDFFVMLSSCSSVLGPPSQANYAAANAFMDTYAQLQKSPFTHFVSLNLPIVEDSETIVEHQDRLRGLMRRGCIPTKMDRLLPILGYCMSDQARKDGHPQIVIGFDRHSISSQPGLGDFQFRNPMLCHLPQIINKSDAMTMALKSIDEVIATTESLDDLRTAVAKTIAEKFSVLVAVDGSDINLDESLETFGLDSLVAIELKNWFARTLHTTIQTSEILDAPDIVALASIVVQRSKLVQNRQLESPHDHILGYSANSEPQDMVIHAKLSPPPLPTLKDTLDLYMNSVSPFLSDAERERVLKVTSELLEPGGLGEKLQQRLEERAKDPKIDNWQFELYNNHVYLNVRAPVNPWQHFYGCHLDSDRQDTQAERAAIISLAALKFKKRLANGVIQRDYLNEDPLCMSSLDFIFNAYREPRSRIDAVRKLPDHDHLVALRNGRVYSIDLKDIDSTTSYSSLRNCFQKILMNTDEPMVCIAALTADERDSWSKVRAIVKDVNLRNSTLVTLVETAAFVVCLDGSSPKTPTERLNDFLLGDISNRWSDKSLQFVVCKNGASAFVCEHAMVDSSTYRQLNDAVIDAIHDHQAEPPWDETIDESSKLAIVEEFTFDTNSTLDLHVSRVHQLFNNSVTRPELVYFFGTQFGSKYLRAKKCPPKTGYQLVIQLASLLYFGYQPPSWETISTRIFHKGRVDIIQVVLPAIAKFCASAQRDDMPVDIRRKLFYEAAKAHVNTATRISRGRGFAGHLYALQEVVQEEEEMPALFRDGTYSKTRPGKIMTDCTEGKSALQEGGFMMPDPEHVWVHYQVEDNGCHFHVKAPRGRTRLFLDALQVAGRTVSALLSSE